MTGPAFNGFEPEAIALLSQLPGFDEGQYASVKQRLGDGLREPGWALIATVAEGLECELTVDKRRSVSPLHRDLRFAAAGSPRYKDHLLLTAWRGDNKATAPTLWIRVDAHSVGFASGIAFTPAIRERWREAIGGSSGESLAKTIETLKDKHRRHDIEVAGDKIKRVPKPWAADHARADLLRLSGFQVRFNEKLPKSVEKPAFASWCAARLQDLMPIHAWLVSELASMGKKS